MRSPTKQCKHTRTNTHSNSAQGRSRTDTNNPPQTRIRDWKNQRSKKKKTKAGVCLHGEMFLSSWTTIFSIADPYVLQSRTLGGSTYCGRKRTSINMCCRGVHLGVGEMYSRTSAGGASTPRTGVLDFSAVFGIAYTSGAGAVCSPTDAGAAYQTGAAHLYATTTACKASPAGATRFPTGAGMLLRTPTGAAESYTTTGEGIVYPAGEVPWRKRDGLNHKCRCVPRRDELNRGCWCSIGCWHRRNILSQATIAGCCWCDVLYHWRGSNVRHRRCDVLHEAVVAVL